jgi:hypothetical protein
VRNRSLGLLRRVRRAAPLTAAVFVLALAGLAQAAPTPPAGRAYEMVSPPDKNGQDVVPDADLRSGTPRALPSANAIVYNARGSFAGNPSNSLFPAYLAVRGETSWSTRGIAPPVRANSLLAPRLFQVSEDLSVNAVMSSHALEPGHPGSWSTDFGCCIGEPLYVRDLVSDTYQLLTPVPAPGGAGGIDGPTPYLSTFMRADADLSHVLFESRAELTPEAVPLADTAVKLYKWSDGTLALESVLPDPDGPGPAEAPAASGSAGGGVSNASDWMTGAISEDGSRSFFTSPALSGARPLYVRENGVTTQISATAFFRGANDDGSKVFFTTGSAGAQTGPLMSYDVASQTPTLLSVDSEPADGTNNTALGLIDFSDDGSRVYFAANSQLVLGEDTAAGPKLYVWDNGVIKFIAQVSSSGSTSDAGMWGTNAPAKEGFEQVTPNGGALLFQSFRPITGYDNSNDSDSADCSGGLCREIFLYRTSEDGVVCVSCDPSGAPPNGDAGDGFGDRLSASGRHLSDDGRRAFFASPDPLVREDVNGEYDVYMWEDGELELISTGRHSDFSSFADASPSGDDVFFVTAERLSGWDRDDSQDMYDARVGGGLPEPPPLSRCVGDECQGQPSRPAFIAPGTSPFRGSGDLVLRPRPSFRIMRVSRAQRSRLARTGRIALGVRVNRAGRVSAVAKSKLGERARMVDRGSKAARKAGTVKVPLRLSKAARRELAREGRLIVRVAVRFAGVREAKQLTLRLRRAVAPASGKGR